VVGSSYRLALPKGMLAWEVSVRVDGRKVPLGLSSGGKRSLTPVISPPEEGSFVLLLVGPRGQRSSVPLDVAPSPQLN
jgi:hypothetical protein